MTLPNYQETPFKGDPMPNFKPFAEKTAARFAQLSAHELFVVDSSKLWDIYLAAFPAGTNPIYRTNTEHDCSCCRNFIKHLGGVVAIVDGKVETLWDVSGLEHPYDVVSKALHEHVLAQPIVSVFRTKERQYGAAATPQVVDGQTKIWNHFHGRIADRHFTRTPDRDVGEAATTMAVFERGLEELTVEAANTVLDLIAAGSLYRGEEHLPALKEFAECLRTYKALEPAERRLFIASNYTRRAARFRNTVIGTLVTDLSDGVDLETAVRSFETKVAPANYKRTTALITPAMVKQAMETIESLGLESALERRLATISDVSVNDVLWVDGSVRPMMKGGVADLLMAAAVERKPGNTAQAADVTIEAFMAEVLPNAKEMSILFKNLHTPNLVAVTAPVHTDSGRLFKWDNGFAWSYNGNVTDSITEKVKKAGGNVDAKLRFSLAWFNYDDLDIHVVEPNGNHIYYANKSGKLDVDMNAGCGTSREPVENVAFKAPKDGVYQVYVNQYTNRETSDVGFIAEIADGNGVKQYTYPHRVVGNVEVGTFVVRDGVIVEARIHPKLNGEGISKKVWGIPTEKFVKVRTVLFSPNYWGDSAVGNKHWFFILEGCKADQPLRGIYNEFLAGPLEKHRKVFEVLGDKTKCPVTDEQLAGLGFSSTKRETVTVRVVTENSTRLFNILF